MNIIPNPIKIAIALGGNLGDVGRAFDRAAELLAAGGVEEIRRAGNFRTAPVDCAPGAPDFLNSALTGRWRGSAVELLKLCQSVERELGRPARHGVNSDRPVDLDLILFGGEIIRSDELTIPHPRASQRLFVLAPLAEIAPDWEFPDQKITVKNALSLLTTSGRRGII